MILISLAALIAACGAAKLDRTYLPPPSAATAGGSPGSLQVPFTRALDQTLYNVPPGGFVNEHQGVVVEAATAGTRASSQQSGLGGSRVSYGSQDSKVGDAAFRITSTHQSSNNNFGSVHGGDISPDLSAFYQPMYSFRPGNIQIIRDYVSNTIRSHNYIDSNKYDHAFETDNGIKVAESGVAVNGIQAEGGYSYTGDDGRVYSVSYTAGEGGFRPQGSHFPTPPPIPNAILKSLEQNAKDEADGIFDDGSYDAKKYNAGGDYTKTNANSKYNDRQSNKFGKRPGSTDGSATFINQYQEAAVTPSFNGQLGFIHGTLDKNTNSNNFKQYNSGNNFNTMSNRNTLTKTEYNNELMNNGFGIRNEYLPPFRGSSESFISAGGNKDIFSIAQPIIQQKLQPQVPFGTHQFNIIRPSSYEHSQGVTSQSASNSQISSMPTNNVNPQGASYKVEFIIDPFSTSQSYNKPLENSAASHFLNKNPLLQQSTLTTYDNNPISSQTFSQSFASVFSSSPQPKKSSQQFISTNSPLDPTQNINIRLPTTQLSTASSGSFNPIINNIGQPQHTNKPSSSFDASFLSVLPTVQPQITLATPLENSQSRDPFSLLDFGKIELLNYTTDPDLTTTDSQSSKHILQTSSNKEQLPTQSTSIFSDNNLLSFSTSPFDTQSPSTSQSFDNTQTTQISHNSKPEVTQITFVANRLVDSDVTSNTQEPPYNGQLNQFTGPTQTTDYSYVYKQPSIPFSTPFVIQQSNNFPSEVPSSKLDKVTQTLTQNLTSTTQYQTQSTSNLSHNPTTIEPYDISSYITIKENEDKASNGITQATISSFHSIEYTDKSNFIKPLQQSELSTPDQSPFTYPSTTPTSATAEVASTLLDNQNYDTQSQLLLEDKDDVGISKISNQQYSSEIYQYNKPAQILPSENQKGDAELSIKTERPQFAVSISQFGQEVATISMGQTTGQPKQQEQQGLSGHKESFLDNQFNQQNIQKPSEKPLSFSVQPFTQNTPAGLNNNEFTFSQFQQHTSPEIVLSNYKPSKFFPSTVPSNIFNTEKQDSQISTTFSDNRTFGQSTTQSDDSSTKETTSSYYQQPNQQTETQFNYQPTTSILGASLTTPEIKEHTKYTSISQRFGVQSSTESSQEGFDNRAITLPPFQQSVTQFTFNPSTSVSNIDHSIFSGFSTQNPDNQFSFPTSFVQPTVTDEPTQFSIQESQGSFDNTLTTISNVKIPTRQSSMTLSETSTLIPSTTQTPSGSTQFEEIYDYKKPTEGLVTPDQNENDEQLNSKFGTQLNIQSTTDYNQKVTEKETTQSPSTQSEAVDTDIEYKTASTSIPSSPQFQTTLNTQSSDPTSTTGEIYEYTIPEQGLIPQSQEVNVPIDQMTQEKQNREQTTMPDESNFELKQTTVFQSTQTPTSTSGTFQTQSNLDSQKTNTLTSQSFPGTKPFDSPPQFAFHSACCKGLKTESYQSTTSSSKSPTIDFNPSIQNRNIEITEKNKLEEKQTTNSTAFQDIDPQKGSQTFAGIGEEFGGPRKPPSFDKMGYHY